MIQQTKIQILFYPHIRRFVWLNWWDNAAKVHFLSSWVGREPIIRCVEISGREKKRREEKCRM